MTPHNRANRGDFAPIVLMPGDPKRAEAAASNFLSSVSLVTDVRGIPGYTGLYKGLPVSVMASGMGAPSMGIYSHELFAEYGVERIIRIGTAGGYDASLEPGSLIVAISCSYDGSWCSQYGLDGTFSPTADWSLIEAVTTAAAKKGKKLILGPILSSDYFSSYNARGAEAWKRWARMGILAQDMESAALYATAAKEGKKAVSILTMTDNLMSGRSVRDEDRASCVFPMIELALDAAVEASK